MKETRCYAPETNPMPFDLRANYYRTQIKITAESLLNLRGMVSGASQLTNPGPLLKVDVSDPAEMIANITLAYRHLEDASMRLGKAIQAFDGGVSCYDKASTVGCKVVPESAPGTGPVEETIPLKDRPACG